MIEIKRLIAPIFITLISMRLTAGVVPGEACNLACQENDFENSGISPAYIYDELRYINIYPAVKVTMTVTPSNLKVSNSFRIWACQATGVKLKNENPNFELSFSKTSEIEAYMSSRISADLNDYNISILETSKKLHALNLERQISMFRYTYDRASACDQIHLSDQQKELFQTHGKTERSSYWTAARSFLDQAEHYRDAAKTEWNTNFAKANLEILCLQQPRNKKC